MNLRIATLENNCTCSYIICSDLDSRGPPDAQATNPGE